MTSMNADPFQKQINLRGQYGREGDELFVDGGIMAD